MVYFIKRKILRKSIQFFRNSLVDSILKQWYYRKIRDGVERENMKKIKIAIVEDEELASQSLKDCLSRFSKENVIDFDITEYREGLSFLDEHVDFDLIFMDIEMPHMNGIEVAKKLRSLDENVSLIFVTNMAQYAIQGYSVDAIDYVLKPIKYARLASLMKKTLRIIGQVQEQAIVLKTTGGMTKIYLSSIQYIEIKDHLLIYHTDQGEIEVWGTIKGAEESLPTDSFCRCSHSVIVHFKYIVSTDKDTIYMTDKKIPISISHAKKKEFLSRFNHYVGL